mgnify:CR=1 FL=1
MIAAPPAITRDRDVTLFECSCGAVLRSSVDRATWTGVWQHGDNPEAVLHVPVPLIRNEARLDVWSDDMADAVVRWIASCHAYEEIAG